jgi:cytochrome c-type protein NapC
MQESFASRSPVRPPRRWRAPARGFHLFGVTVWGMLLFLAGIVFWGGFNTALEATNTEQFCISCHEMRDNVYAEYKETIHYRNPAGVRATCPDCHVPRPWIYKIARKIRASNELFHKIVGTVDTREKFEAHRLELAGHVWDTMKSTDSRECRNCHSQVYMDLEKQDKSAAKKHAPQYLQETGKTCIDCHKGIAHHLPKAEDEKG